MRRNKMAIRNIVNNSYRTLHQLSKVIKCVLFIMLLGVIVAACAEEGDEDMIEEESEVIVEEQNFTEEVSPKFLNLEYIYSIEEVDLSRRTFDIDGEFTWLETYGSCGYESFEEIREYIIRDYGIELPETMSLDTNSSFIILSIGRRLKMLYYFEEHQHTTFSGDTIARPVFEREYYPSTIFVYQVNPLPRIQFMPNSLSTDDFRQFNTLNNIPFEVWPFDSLMRFGAIHPERRPPESEHYSWQRVWQEFEESVDGYIGIGGADMRSLPTRRSRMINRLLVQGEEFIVYGYVEDGEEINGCRRWYYIRTPIDAGNQVGYIHSSFVSYSADN